MDKLVNMSKLTRVLDLLVKRLNKRDLFLLIIIIFLTLIVLSLEPSNLSPIQKYNIIRLIIVVIILLIVVPIVTPYLKPKKKKYINKKISKTKWK